MISFESLILPPGRIQELEDSMKKRKRDDHESEVAEEKQQQIGKNMKPMINTELNLQTPLPVEWQRCLDIKSGQIYYYNTRTQKKTSNDPRASPEPRSPNHDMGLDLELNLPCGPVEKISDANNSANPNSGSSSSNNSGNHLFNTSDRNNKNTSPFTRSLSWLTFDQGDDQREMVTAVCKKCHMLVVMCKSSPACPNCKFVHPPDQSLPTMFNKKVECPMLRII